MRILITRQDAKTPRGKIRQGAPRSPSDARQANLFLLEFKKRELATDETPMDTDKKEINYLLNRWASVPHRWLNFFERLRSIFSWRIFHLGVLASWRSFKSFGGNA
jgi:hypothetical protein